MANQWHYRRGDNESGPVSPQELRRLAATGELEPADEVRKEGMSQWVAASQVKGLFASPVLAEDMPPPLPASFDVPPPLPFSPATANKPEDLAAKARLGVPVLSKRIAIAVFAVIALVAAGTLWLFFGTSKSSLNQRLAGEWTSKEGTIVFQGGSVLLPGPMRRTIKATYAIKSANQVTISPPNTDVTVIATLVNPDELQMESSSKPGEVLVLRRRFEEARDHASNREATPALGRGRRPGSLSTEGGEEDLGDASRLKGGNWSANTLRRHSSLPSDVSANGDGLEGQLRINRDGSYSGSIRGEGFSGRSTMNSDGSGVGEYDVDGKKMRVQLDGKGGASVDLDGQKFTLPKP